MKVALVHPQYRPDGGAEKAIVYTLKALLQKGVQVKIISRNWAEQDENVEVVKCNPFYMGRLWRKWGFARKAKRILYNIDIDIVQSQVRIPGCDIYRAGGGVHREWLRQRDRISTPLRKNLTRFSPFHKYKTYVETKLYADPRLKAVICNSQMVKKEIIDYFKFPQEKIYVIYNAVDLKKFNSEKNLDKRKILRDKLGLSHNQSAFLFVGSGFERKGLSVLLDCMVYLHKDCFLMVIGKDKELEKYIKKTKRLGISERVFFLGMQKDIAPFYAAADAFVLPTLYDAFANTVLEAMAASLPVITSYKCGAVDLIENGNNGFVCDSLDKTKIIEYMKILRDPVTRQTIGKNGRDTVKNFTVENMSNSLYSLYEKILA